MSSRHYGSTGWVVHLYGQLPFHHVWKVYGTEDVARVQAVRMERAHASWGAKAEVFKIEGSPAHGTE